MYFTMYPCEIILLNFNIAQPRSSMLSVSTIRLPIKLFQGKMDFKLKEYVVEKKYNII